MIDVENPYPNKSPVYLKNTVFLFSLFYIMVLFTACAAPINKTSFPDVKLPLHQTSTINNQGGSIPKQPDKEVVQTANSTQLSGDAPHLMQNTPTPDQHQTDSDVIYGMDFFHSINQNKIIILSSSKDGEIYAQMINEVPKLFLKLNFISSSGQNGYFIPGKNTKYLFFVSLTEEESTYQTSDEIITIDIFQQRFWVHKPKCKINHFTPSETYLMYQCIDTPAKWVFSQIENPQIEWVRMIPQENKYANLYEPLWIRYEELAFHYLNTHICSTSLLTWSLVCQDFPFWINSLSPDGMQVEIRKGIYLQPEEIGVLPATCIQKIYPSCHPQFVRSLIPSRMFEGDLFQVIWDSIWSPDSEKIVYLVSTDTGSGGPETAYPPKITDLWMFDRNTENFTHFASFDGISYTLGPWLGENELFVTGTDSGNWQSVLVSVPSGELITFPTNGSIIGVIESK